MNFNKAIITLVIPIALQNFISAMVNIIDTTMMASVSQSAMSAISLSGQITFILMLLFFGLSTGAGILVAQYWGNNNTIAIKHILCIACMFSTTLSFLFFITSFCFPASLIRIFTYDTELIVYGSNYQRIVSFSYLAISLSQIYFSVTKCMGKAKFSAIVISASLLLNIILNALCIFVLFPEDTEKTIIGVAVGTVLVRVLELIVCIIHSLRPDNIRFSLPIRDNIQKILLQDFLRYTIPIQANNIVYGGALAATVVIIGHVNSDMVAANAIAVTVRNLAIVLCSGIGRGGGILIGKYLGSGDIQSAKKAGYKIFIYVFIFGILAGLSILLARPLIINFIKLNKEAIDYLKIMLLVCSFYCVVKAVNSAVIGGIFCAGGDTKFGFWCDVFVMWGIVIPLGCLCAFVWHVPPAFLYLVLCSDEFIKAPIGMIRFFQNQWLKNITRTFN